MSKLTKETKFGVTLELDHSGYEPKVIDTAEEYFERTLSGFKPTKEELESVVAKGLAIYHGDNETYSEGIMSAFINAESFREFLMLLIIFVDIVGAMEWEKTLFSAFEIPNKENALKLKAAFIEAKLYGNAPEHRNDIAPKRQEEGKKLFAAPENSKEFASLAIKMMAEKLGIPVEDHARASELRED